MPVTPVLSTTMSLLIATDLGHATSTRNPAPVRRIMCRTVPVTVRLSRFFCTLPIQRRHDQESASRFSPFLRASVANSGNFNRNRFEHTPHGRNYAGKTARLEGESSSTEPTTNSRAGSQRYECNGSSLVTIRRLLRRWKARGFRCGFGCPGLPGCGCPS
jgi:hypothetical protein